ncbi:MAG: glycerol-3-phosphate 1-O-acyltransferase PlsY [Synergistaceae bacterium]|jgi:glycerol-3-phosphate acyltransferase PlsY|nr:glycerol-3-phosphate 1-O-acyltransferase PlsY [Synergistaceae bacterium]
MESVGLVPALAWLLLGYLMGSCPTGFILVKLMRGEDIRNFGSGNIGATNVGRVLGKRWAVLTAVIDMLKGGVAVLMAMLAGQGSPALLSMIGIAGVLGHDYPVWLKFKGGKGVATTFGVFAFYDFWNPLPVIIGGLLWVAIREATRIVSLASMVSLLAAALLMPLFMMDRAYYLSGLFLAALTIWRHRDNIKRVISGTENKVSRFFLR